jgi:cell division protein FtsI/penicillin-binding protein 2
MSFLENFKKNISHHWRINVLFIFILLISSSVAARIFYLQVLSYDDFIVQAEDQREFSSVLLPERGKVYMVDRFGVSTQLATNGNEYSIYAIPKDIKNKEDFAKKVSELLEIDYDTLFRRISKKDDPYEPIKSIISKEKKIELEELKLSGIGFKVTKRRAYPNNNLASHLSGFLSDRNKNGIGQYGIEEYYNKELSGKPGFVSGEKDSFGRDLLSKDKQSYSAINGDLIFLSVDPNVQFKIEDKLKSLVERWNAESGSVIVMEPSSGRILGMVNYPNFDPNNYSSVENISDFTNKAVSGQYEPGSIFKPITMAIGIDAGAITPDTTYEDKGYLSISGYTIKNYDEKVHGVNTMTEVLEKSLNTGTVFAVNKISKNTYFDYIKKFGFGEKTGVDLPAEANGDIRNLAKNRDINYATASFGQGIAVTPLQMLSAISVIANGGKLIKPRVVDQILHANGSKKYLETEEKRRVISKETAEKVEKMMVSVVENGFDKAKIPGYFIAGKTGTAQIPSKDGKGYSEDTVHSFIGFAPAYDAKFALLFKLDKPKDVRFASQSLTEPFKEIMEYLLHYYEVSPDY